jgi:hypothetical protein
MSFNIGDTVLRIRGPPEFSSTLNITGTIKNITAKNTSRSGFETPTIYHVQFKNGKYQFATEDQLSIVQPPSPTRRRPQPPGVIIHADPPLIRQDERPSNRRGSSGIPRLPTLNTPTDMTANMLDNYRVSVPEVTSERRDGTYFSSQQRCTVNLHGTNYYGYSYGVSEYYPDYIFLTLNKDPMYSEFSVIVIHKEDESTLLSCFAEDNEPARNSSLRAASAVRTTSPLRAASAMRTASPVSRRRYQEPEQYLELTRGLSRQSSLRHNVDEENSSIDSRGVSHAHFFNPYGDFSGGKLKNAKKYGNF